MDLILKFGNHYYTSGEFSFLGQLFMSFIGAFFGFGFALLLYYFQNKKDDKSSEIESQQKYKDQLQYFKLLLEGSLDFIEKQLKYLEQYIKEQKKSLTEQKIYHESANNDIERLLAIDLQSIFIAYRENQKDQPNWIKEYTDFFHSLDFVKGKIQETRNIYNNNMDQGWTDLSMVKDIIDNIPNLLSKYALRISNELGEERWNDEKYIFLDSQIKNYRELIDSGANIDKMNDSFLKVLIEDILDNYKEAEFAEEIMSTCKNARFKISDIKLHMDDMLKQFSAVKGYLDESIDNLHQMKERI